MKINVELDLRQNRTPYELLKEKSRGEVITKIRVGALVKVNLYLEYFGLKLKNDCLQINTNQEEFQLQRPVVKINVSHFLLY